MNNTIHPTINNTTPAIIKIAINVLSDLNFAFSSSFKLVSSSLNAVLAPNFLHFIYVNIDDKEKQKMLDDMLKFHDNDVLNK